jgi:hypothetical protein
VAQPGSRDAHQQLAGTPLSVDAPQINDSIAAARAARTTPGR